MVRDRYRTIQAEDPASARLRFFSGNSGATLTAHQPYNNIVRSTIQCLGAVLGGAQSIHVMGYDEAYELPSEEAVTLSLRTQQIIALESGVTRTADPLAGSYYVEGLTDEMEQGGRGGAGRDRGRGGSGACPWSWAFRSGGSPTRPTGPSRTSPRAPAQGGRERARRPGDDGAAQPAMQLFQLDPGIADRQMARTGQRLAARDGRAVAGALEQLRQDTDEGCERDAGPARGGPGRLPPWGRCAMSSGPRSASSVSHPHGDRPPGGSAGRGPGARTTRFVAGSPAETMVWPPWALTC